MTLAATLAGAGHHQLGVHEADFLFARLEGRPHSGVPWTDLWGQHGAMAKAVLGRTPGSPVSRSERGQSRGDPCPAPLRIRRQREISLPQRGVSPSTVAFSGDPQSCSQGQSEPSTQSSGSTVYHLWLRRSRSRFSYLLRGVCAHICVCACVCTHTCVHVHMHVHVCVHMRVCMCECARVWICTPMCMCACTCVCTPVCHVCASACAYVHCTCTHVCACVCMLVCVCAYMCVCVCMCMHVYACEHACTCGPAQMCACECACLSAHTCSCMCAHVCACVPVCVCVPSLCGACGHRSIADAPSST